MTIDVFESIQSGQCLLNAHPRLSWGAAECTRTMPGMSDATDGFIEVMGRHCGTPGDGLEDLPG
jgi:hypothetical protein